MSRPTVNHPSQRLAHGIAALWRLLCGPWPARFLALFSLGMLLAFWRLPQLPGQLADEPAAAARWLRATADAAGAGGDLGLLLGLYDVLHSPTTGVLLAAWALLAASWLMDALARLRFYHHLSAQPPVAAPLQVDPRPLPPGSPILRQRLTLPAAAPAVAAALTTWLTTRQGAAPAPQGVATVIPSPDAATDTAPDEQHWTIVQRPRLTLLRPLLPLGIGLAVIGLWLTTAFGWQVNAPPLAAGEQFQSPQHDLTLRHVVTLTPTVQSELDVHVGESTLRLSGAQAARHSIARATIAVAPAYAGVWVTSDAGALQLALPAPSGLPSSRQSQLGLVFPDPGSEESILLPELGVGLRVVRSSSDNTAFVLELYRSQEVQPVYRAELTAAGRAVIPLGNDQPDLIVTSLPGLHVTVRHFPWLWLAWVGLVVAAAGSLSLLRPPAWLTAQVAPWGEDRAVVVLQSDRADLLADLRRQLASLEEPAAPLASLASPGSSPTPSSSSSPD